MGHVPPGPVPAEGAGSHVPGRQHRRDRAGRATLSLGRRDTGQLGEELAARFLQRRGAEILARNLQVPGGEIDLLVRFGSRRVVVEVRTVGGGRPAAEAFGAEKARQVWRLARRLRPPVARVDLVAVGLHPGGADLHWVPGIG